MRVVAKRRTDGIVFNEGLAEEGAVVFAKARELGLEGIVSKRAGSLYKSGPSGNWLKTKTRVSSGREPPMPASPRRQRHRRCCSFASRMITSPRLQAHSPQ